jgi:Peptidase family M13
VRTHTDASIRNPDTKWAGVAVPRQARFPAPLRPVGSQKRRSSAHRFERASTGMSSKRRPPPTQPGADTRAPPPIVKQSRPGQSRSAHHAKGDREEHNAATEHLHRGAPEDARRYGELAQCFVNQYGREVGLAELHLNGQLTLGENLADNGGLRLAHRAFKPDPKDPTIEGFTPPQRFFLAWAQIRCENTTDAALRQQLQSDGHSPGRQRVNVVVSNMTEFASAFGCHASTLAPEDRCALW